MDDYLRGKWPNAKAWHHREERLGFQRKSPQNNFRRIIACPIPSGAFCCDSVSYVPQSESKAPLEWLLAVLNSRLLDWYFRLGSTNSSVNEYQFNTLPVPVVSWNGPLDEELEQQFSSHLDGGLIDAAVQSIEPSLDSPPFSKAVVNCVVASVRRIIEIEQGRGDIARTERSALAASAQPVQDLIDRMLYRMAGMSDEEARGLETRLSEML